MASVEVLGTTACDFPLYMVHTACTACSYLRNLFLLCPKLEGTIPVICVLSRHSPVLLDVVHLRPEEPAGREDWISTSCSWQAATYPTKMLEGREGYRKYLLPTEKVPA